MAWTAPRTWVAGETITDTIMNTHVRDNLIALRAAETILPTDATNTDAGETNLHSYSVPAGLLATNGQALRWTTNVSLAANGNTKTLKVYFGSTALTVYTGAANNKNLMAVAYVIRIAPTVQRFFFQMTSDVPSYAATFSAAAETLSGAVTMKFTGQGAATADLTQFESFLEFIG